MPQLQKAATAVIVGKLMTNQMVIQGCHSVNQVGQSQWPIWQKWTRSLYPAFRAVDKTMRLSDVYSSVRVVISLED